VADQVITSSTVRMLSLVALIVVTVLGGVLALGRVLAEKPQRTRPATVSSPAPTPRAANDESNPDIPVAPSTDASRTRRARPTPTKMADPDISPVPSTEPSAGGPPLPLEADGPYGSRMTTGSREVALTFDDGPDPRYTPQMLALLRKYEVKATFCVVGTNVREYPELVRAIVADGHTLCNHTWDHDLELGSRSRDAIRVDLTRTNEAIRAAVPGARIAYYRQPGGNWTSRVVSVARDLGMTPLNWAVDPQDWSLPGARSIYATVTAETVAGDIVLMHDAGGDRQGTIAALRSILPNLTRRFYLEALPTSAHSAR
jgi:peptidoglycan/xylan/chitin deacetylase (PgdA/CDA1 family)